jgi:hypothetical protein
MITGQAIIDEYFSHTEIDAITPLHKNGISQSESDEIDQAIPELYAYDNGLGEVLDYNGSEVMSVTVLPSWEIILELHVFEREFENGSWNEKKLRAYGTLVSHTYQDGYVYPVYDISKVEEI